MKSDQAREALAHLTSVRHLYPFGIPDSAIEQGAAADRSVEEQTASPSENAAGAISTRGGSVADPAPARQANGIGTSETSAAASRQSLPEVSTEARVCFLVSSAASSLSTFRTTPEGTLLTAAVGKGMKLPPESVAILLFSHPGAEGILGACAGRPLVILGEDVWNGVAPALGDARSFDEARGSFQRSTGATGIDYIVSHALGAVLSSPDRKREFWSDLQQVLGRL